MNFYKPNTHLPMKKLTIMLGAIAFVLTMSLQSCGGGGVAGNSPGAIVKKSINLVAEKKYDKVVELYAKKDGTAFTDEEKGKIVGLMTMANAELVKKQGVKSLDIVEEKISEDGKTADVKWKVTYGNGEVDNNDGKLIKVGSDWKMVIGN
jgi:hypothetical protein